jgi:hypothetical protein
MYTNIFFDMFILCVNTIASMIKTNVLMLFQASDADVPSVETALGALTCEMIVHAGMR